MAEAYSICTICQTNLYDGKDILTTRCKHMFHAECIAKNANINDNLCPNCREPIPSFRTVFTGYESKPKKKTDEIISNEDDENGWNCSLCTLKNSRHADTCSACHQGTRMEAEKIKLSEKVTSIPISIERNLEQKCNIPYCHTQNPSSCFLCDECSSKMPPSPTPSTSSQSLYPSLINTALQPIRNNPIKSDQIKWLCEFCNYPDNLFDNEKCIACDHGVRPNQTKLLSNEYTAPPTHLQKNGHSQRQNTSRTSLRRNPYETYSPQQQNQSSTQSANKNITSSSQKSVVDNEDYSPAIVYIPNLPTNKNDDELAQAIRSRLQDAHNIKVSEVQCFPNLGVAIVHISKQEDKDYLINRIQSTVLFPNTNDSTKVTFTEELEVTFYIVFKKNPTFPSNDAIARRWRKLFPSNHRPHFQTLSIQFPGVIKVTSFSIIELQAVVKCQSIEVDGQKGYIFTNVDYSYLEELPNSDPKLDARRIFCFIATQLDKSDRARTNNELCQEEANTLFQHFQSLSLPIKELKSKFYIEYNEQSSNAIILAANCLHKWIEMTFLNINGQMIFKTSEISSKLIIKPIPLDFPLHLIFDHPIFNNSIKTDLVKLNNEHLIVEINNKETYDECLKIRTFKIMRNNGDRLELHILPYSIIENPDNNDINVENWYGVQMEKFKPDITKFDSRHPIFRYRWNSKIWLDQFLKNKEEYEQITNQDEYRKNDFIRRMLRVTVMLNTMGTMRKRKYILENTEILIEPPSPLVTIVYTHQSKLIQTGQAFTPPFSSTHVRVINEDCLISYNTLVSSRMKPVLLNMANEEKPGGGYRTGAGAQEENLFRRSNYHMSLDHNMEQEQNQYSNSKRNYCTSTGQISFLDINQSLYPIDEYGAIYTSGITVFRGTEDEGYPFLKTPLYDVCGIAIAAYSGPPIQKSTQRLIRKFAVRTRKKIETLFAIAYKNGHDSMVLSALGCGAFKNPPQHIALIFKSVILQYAGFFKEIVFSIIDDHNTGGRINPNGNYLPFQQALDNYVVRPPTTQAVGMSLGPYRLINSKGNTTTTVEQFVICDIPPCEYATSCKRLDDENHCHSNSHPPVCPFGSECNENLDDVHYQTFIHRRKCSKGGRCSSTDANHLAEFDHPKYCDGKSHCTNITPNHLNCYRHVPICENGVDCDLKFKHDAEHLARFRHCQHPCEFGGHCTRFQDQKHLTNAYHPFNTPCPYTPFSCEIHTKFLQSNNEQNKSKNGNQLDEIEKHCYRYSHICPWGRLCNDKSEQHLSMTIHIIRQMCPNKDSCKRKMEEDHLDSYSHPNVRDIRFLCRHSDAECPDRLNHGHIIKYRHTRILDYLGVAKYFALNKPINFVQNQLRMTQLIRDYVKRVYQQSWKDVSVPDDLLEWVAALQPVHRCKASIFESILVHGQVMSSSYMDNLEDPTFIVHTVEQHKRVRKILASAGSAVQADARELITLYVHQEFNKNKSNEEKQDHNDDLQEYQIDLKEQTLQHTLAKSDLDEIHRCTSQIVQASIKLYSKKTGIRHAGDLTFGTNDHVFSILGPNTGSYYGDIIIVFKRDIMLHPDSNFTMQAATMYTDKTYKCRPWISKSGSAEGNVEQFHSTKLHCSIPGYEYVTALELMAITGTQNKTMNVHLGDIIYRWKNIDSHQVIEVHLPQLIPLRYIDHIYMPDNVFKSLSVEAQKNVRELFPSNLTITKHVVDLTVDLLAFSKPDDSRIEYFNYVIDQMLKSIKNQQEKNANLLAAQLLTSYGMTVTIPATNFEKFITNPLTISQSMHQYLDQSHKTSKSDDSIYIYWKAIRGDFMLILTNEMIEVGKIQHDLIYLTCYIAPLVINTNNDVNYNEHYTYINHSLPSAHRIVVERQNFKVGSNIFHKGCNPNDYILYCLKLNPKKGQISLMNAGVNGIYNHTILKCTFASHELDLMALDYIHVSAGHQSVPIRNLIISHELITELHPKFDKEFSSRIVEDSHDRSQSTERTKSEEQSQIMDDLKPCKDSIYCVEQYSLKKSANHNQKFSHPCRFTDSCKHIHRIPHSIQFTHNKHNVPICRQDMNCKQVTDPVHRYSYRHTDLPDLLYPCRDQQCLDSTFEHKKKYFHGEQINVPGAKYIPKGAPKMSTSKPTSNEHSSSIWSSDDEKSNDEDVLRIFYNDAAGKSNIRDAQSYDKYGNPNERIYDLGRDGAYIEFSILIAQFYVDDQFNDTAMQVPINALKVKGFQVKHVKTENECITELASNRYQIAWIISTARIQNQSFITALTKFHSSGGAIFLFADNIPYVCHASEFLRTKFGITVNGNYQGEKTLTYEEKGHQQTGHFGRHEIFTGITNLFEGITICHPVYSTPASRTMLTTIATATDGNSSIAVYDPPTTSNEGRLCLDCGFTKLYVNWDSAGTARYIVNASCWLLGIEKRLNLKKNKNRK